MTHAWQRQPTETDKSWEAFEIYLGMGAGRSTAKVAQELGKNKALIQRWSRNHGWVRRVAEYDAHQVKRREQLSDDLHRKEYGDRLRKLLHDEEQVGELLHKLTIKSATKINVMLDALAPGVEPSPRLATLMRATASVADAASSARAQALGVEELLEILGEEEEGP